MKRSLSKTREEARRLYLTGEATTNSEIATRLHVKSHTVGRWARQEDWTGLRSKIDIRAAELFVEKIATDRMNLNLGHFRMWQLLVARLAEDLKTHKSFDIRDLERVAAILEKTQKGQRLAKGLSMTGETEEAIRAQSEAEMRRVIDSFIDAVKEIPDEETRERIRQAILRSLPDEEDDGTGDGRDPVPLGSAR
jgi:Putative ATPase subunit of terminase (gpP-like)